MIVDDIVTRMWSLFRMQALLDTVVRSIKLQLRTTGTLQQLKHFRL